MQEYNTDQALLRRYLLDVLLVHPLRTNEANLLVLLRQRPCQHVRWTSGKPL